MMIQTHHVNTIMWYKCKILEKEDGGFVLYGKQFNSMDLIISYGFAQLFNIVILSHIYVYNIRKILIFNKYFCYSTISHRPNLKNKTGVILYFSYCQYIPFKDPNQQCVSPSLKTWWIFICSARAYKGHLNKQSTQQSLTTINGTFWEYVWPYAVMSRKGHLSPRGRW